MPVRFSGSSSAKLASSSDYFFTDTEMEDYMMTEPLCSKKMDSYISSGETLCDVIKAGYLKKMKTNKKKYFVVRQKSPLGPARLEYYDTEKRFSKPGAIPKRITKIRDFWNIGTRKEAKQKTSMVIYTRDDCLCLMADNELEHDLWMSELAHLHQRETIHQGHTTTFESIWNVKLMPSGLGAVKNHSGRYRLCLNTTHVSLIRLDMEIADLAIPLSSIRRCGHNAEHFVINVGRSAPTGEGDLVLQVDDSNTSQNMHEVILAAMAANKVQDTSSSFRTRSRSYQNTKRPSTATNYRGSTAGSTDLVPMSRPRTMSESTKNNNTPNRMSPKSIDRRVASSIGRTAGLLTSTASSPFSSCSSIEHSNHNFRIRSDSSGSRATTTSGEDNESHHSYDHGMVEDIGYLDMTCGVRPPDNQTIATVEDAYAGVMETSSHHSNASSRHSFQSLDNITEDSGYMDMTSGGSSSSSKQDEKSASRRPSLISPPADEDSYCIHSSLDMDYSLIVRSTSSPDHTTPVAESQPQTNFHITPPDRLDTTDSSDYNIMQMSFPQKTTGCPNCAQIESESRLMSPNARHPSSSVPISRTPPIVMSLSLEQDYLHMGPCHSLPTVQERSGETCIRLEPNPDKGFGIIFPTSDNKDSIKDHFYPDEDFPKRAYSVGSRSDVQRPKNPLLKLSDKEDKNDVKSSSAPHLLLDHKRRSPGSSRGSPRSFHSASPASRSRKSSRDEPDEDSELLMEISFDRVRTGSSGSDCVKPRTCVKSPPDSMRPRTSSWGQSQAHRPRAHSHASKLKRAETQINHSRSSSQELIKHARRPQATPGRTGSSESLRKIHFVSPDHDYAEIDSSSCSGTTREIQQLAESMNEMTMKYTEITGPVGIVRDTGTRGGGTTTWKSRHQPFVSYHSNKKDSIDAMDTYIVSEPLKIKRRGSLGSSELGIIPPMVDVWSPQIQPGDEDEDEYACLNPPFT